MTTLQTASAPEPGENRGAPERRFACGVWSGISWGRQPYSLDCPHVVSVQPVGVTQVEASATDDWMGPSGAFATLGELEPADQSEPGRRWLDQADRAAFAHRVKHPARTGERALANTSVGVHLPARLPVEANPLRIIAEVGRAVEITVHEDYAAMAVVKVLGTPYWHGRGLAGLDADLQYARSRARIRRSGKRARRGRWGSRSWPRSAGYSARIARATRRCPR